MPHLNNNFNKLCFQCVQRLLFSSRQQGKNGKRGKDCIIRLPFLMMAVILTACTTLPNKQSPNTSTQEMSVPPPEQGERAIQLGTPHHLALLVPLQGSLASSGKAIKSGFLAAHEAAPPEAHISQVNVIDTTAVGDIRTAYQQAIDQGADFIVGPLAKPDVRALSTMGDIKVPILTLNYLSPSSPAPANIYQFGLSPLDEAVQAAALAKQADHHAAIVIAPRSEWGASVAQAFRHEWESLGGTVTDSLVYTGPITSLSKQVKQLLHFHEAANKHVLPTRRKDFDVIFLVATPSIARQIHPLLKFYFAGDIPVYATSLIYSGLPNPALDSDLEGVTFCDAPWILNEKHTQNNARLFALGQDAYQISTQLNKLIDSADSFEGATGNLFLNDQHRVVRKLVCAQFHHGTPVMLTEDK